MRHPIVLAAAAASLALFTVPAVAQSAGELEYLSACSACHGTTGHGDGSLSDLLTIEIPDLTMISAENDGEFPMLDVIQIIDGRTGVRGHGGPMAIWGDRFTAQIEPPIGPYGTEIIVRGRILALAQYLESIQQ